MDHISARLEKQDEAYQKLEFVDPLTPNSTKDDLFWKSFPDSEVFWKNSHLEVETYERERHDRSIAAKQFEETKQESLAQDEDYREVLGKLGCLDLEHTGGVEALAESMRKMARVVPSVLEPLSERDPAVGSLINDLGETKSSLVHKTRVEHYLWSRSFRARSGVSSLSLSDEEFSPVLDRADALCTMPLGTVPLSWPESVKVFGEEMEIQGQSCTQLALLWYCRVMTNQKVSNSHLNAIVASLLRSPNDAAFVVALLEASYGKLISTDLNFNMALCSVRCADVLMKIEPVEGQRKVEALQHATWLWPKIDSLAIASLLANIDQSQLTTTESIEAEGKQREALISYGATGNINLIADQERLIVARPATITIFPGSNLRLEITADAKHMIFKINDDAGKDVGQIPVDVVKDTARLTFVAKHFPSLMKRLAVQTSERFTAVVEKCKADLAS